MGALQEIAAVVHHAHRLVSHSLLFTPNLPCQGPIHHFSPVPSGQGEQVFPSLLQTLADNTKMQRVASGCCWDLCSGWEMSLSQT